MHSSRNVCPSATSWPLPPWQAPKIVAKQGLETPATSLLKVKGSLTCTQLHKCKLALIVDVDIDGTGSCSRHTLQSDTVLSDKMGFSAQMTLWPTELELRGTGMPGCQHLTHANVQGQNNVCILKWGHCCYTVCKSRPPLLQAAREAGCLATSGSLMVCPPLDVAQKGAEANAD